MAKHTEGTDKDGIHFGTLVLKAKKHTALTTRVNWNQNAKGKVSKTAKHMDTPLILSIVSHVHK
jgi:hypothetical protein